MNKVWSILFWAAIILLTVLAIALVVLQHIGVMEPPKPPPNRLFEIGITSDRVIVVEAIYCHDRFIDQRGMADSHRRPYIKLRCYTADGYAYKGTAIFWRELPQSSEVEALK